MVKQHNISFPMCAVQCNRTPLPIFDINAQNVRHDANLKFNLDDFKDVTKGETRSSFTFHVSRPSFWICQQRPVRNRILVEVLVNCHLLDTM